MPVIKSAKKKLRQDKKRQEQNKSVKEKLKELIKKAKTEKTAESIRLAVQATDKAAKIGIVHANKSARIKSALSKLIAKKEDKKVTETKAVSHPETSAHGEKTHKKIRAKSPAKKA